MSEYTATPAGKPHHVLGIVLGILGIAIALLLTWLTGIIAGAVAAILGIIAILLGFAARKYGKGIGSIIIGALAVILAVVMTFSSVGIMNTLKDEAAKTGKAPLVEKYASQPYLGILGFILNAAKDGENVEELKKEIDLLNAQTQNKTIEQKPAEEKPAEEQKND